MKTKKAVCLWFDIEDDVWIVSEDLLDPDNRAIESKQVGWSRKNYDDAFHFATLESDQRGLPLIEQ